MRYTTGCFLLLCVTLALSLGACGEGGADDGELQKVVYEVRGRIDWLPSPDSPVSDLQIFHEEIPSFLHTWPDGEQGMRAMRMPFPLGPRIDLSGYSVGDKVNIAFEVDYDRESGDLLGYRIVEMERLPDDVELDLGGRDPE